MFGNPPDYERDDEATEHKNFLSSAEPSDRPSDALPGAGTMPEVPQRLSQLQAQLLPALLLHIRRRTVEYPWQ